MSKRTKRRLYCRECLYFRQRPLPLYNKYCKDLNREPYSIACLKYTPLRCKDCLYFVTGTCKIKPGPNKLACDRIIHKDTLKAKSEIPDLSDKEVDVAQKFEAVLLDIFAAEKAAVMALDSLQAKMEKQGHVVPVNPTLMSYVSLGSKFLLIKKLFKLYGIEEFIPDVVKYILDKQMQAVKPSKGG